MDSRHASPSAFTRSSPKQHGVHGDTEGHGVPTFLPRKRERTKARKGADILMRNPGGQEDPFSALLASWFPYRSSGFRVFALSRFRAEMPELRESPCLRELRVASALLRPQM